MLRERNDTYMLLFAVIDMAAAVFAFSGAFFVRFFIQAGESVNISEINILSYLYIGLSIIITQVVVFYFMNMYRPAKIGLLAGEFSGVVFGTILTIFVALGFIFFLKTHRYSRLVILYFGILNLIFVTLFRSIVRRIIKMIHRSGKKLQSVLIIGTESLAARIEGVINRNSLYGYSIAGFVRLDFETESVVKPGRILGTLNELPLLLTRVKPFHVIYASNNVDNRILLDAIKYCSHEGIHLHLVPNFSGLLNSKLYLENIDGVSFITLRDVPARRGFNRLIKRIFDLLFSFLFIVIFSPFYILISFLIKITSRGPVFFKQERVGLNNKTFNLFKFRTMYVQKAADSDTIWTKKRDPRVTPVGRILRKLSLDETPQFFNVLTGKMSVVGPRPERPYWVEQYKEQYMGYMQRHGMKAGITGWAQINGLRGDTSIERRVAADIYYIENWSFLLDLKIIFLTPFKSVIDRNAY